VTATTAADSSSWPESLFEVENHRGVSRPYPSHARLRGVHNAEVIDLHLNRWHGPLLPEEIALLGSMRSPVLDVGCGPGRHAAGLARAGIAAVGIDTSAAAVRAARRRGASAVQVSVFGPVPNPGGWATILLLDGNIGIGGDPDRLLRRVRELAAPGAAVVVEVDPPGSGSRRLQVRVHHAGRTGRAFPWASVSAADISAVAAKAGLVTNQIEAGGKRWFAQLQRL
jgi:SAM-dependent methyltransferase